MNELQNDTGFLTSVFFLIDFCGQESIYTPEYLKRLAGREGRRKGTGKNPNLHTVNGCILKLGMKEIARTSQLGASPSLMGRTYPILAPALTHLGGWITSGSKDETPCCALICQC